MVFNANKSRWGGRVRHFFAPFFLFNESKQHNCTTLPKETKSVTSLQSGSSCIMTPHLFRKKTCIARATTHIVLVCTQLIILTLNVIMKCIDLTLLEQLQCVYDRYPIFHKAVAPNIKKMVATLLFISLARVTHFYSAKYVLLSFGLQHDLV